MKCVQIDQKNRLKIAQIWHKNAKLDKDFAQNRSKSPERCNFGQGFALFRSSKMLFCGHTSAGASGRPREAPAGVSPEISVFETPKTGLPLSGFTYLGGFSDEIRVKPCPGWRISEHFDPNSVAEISLRARQI
jgi:hypothetical protein